VGPDGQNFLTGWLGDFIPYVFNSEKRKRNKERKINFDDLNSAAASFSDFKLIDAQYTLKEYDMKLITGFFGPAWDERVEALRPAMGWAFVYLDERPLKLV
jgi:hypothetical protein